MTAHESEKSRREFLGEFLKWGTLLLGNSVFGAFLPRQLWAGEDRHSKKPRFFLFVLVPGGLDCSYLFDARSLEMTQAGLIQNYLSESPSVWRGINGTECLSTPIAQPLAPFRDQFSVINGVHMTRDVISHSSSMNYLVTGGILGGSTFLSEINAAVNPLVLDSIQNKELGVDLKAAEKTLSLSPASAMRLLRNLRFTAIPAERDPAIAFARERLRALSLAQGLLSEGTRMFADGVARSGELASILRRANWKYSPEEDEHLEFLRFALELFRLGGARSAVLSFDTYPGLDAHSVPVAQAQPKRIAEVIRSIAGVFRVLKTTAFDNQRSFLDVTTLLVASEFGRTMRQDRFSIHETGTNHNPFSNSVWIGGSGIRGGRVIGESDFKTAGEKLSRAHLEIDPDRLSTMGRPFDFSREQARSDLPDEYRSSDYLGISSVINTVYRLFDVPRKNYRTIPETEQTAPTLDGLIRV